jgi:hypothetical protein
MPTSKTIETYFLNHTLNRFYILFMFDCVSGKHPVFCRPDRWAKIATHSETKISVFLKKVCDIFMRFFFTVYSKMSEFSDMLKDLTEEKFNLCKAIRQVI